MSNKSQIKLKPRLRRGDNRGWQETEIGEIPEEWEVRRLGDYCLVKGGKRLPKGDTLIEEKTRHPYIRIKDITNDGIDKSNLLYLTEETYKKISRYIVNKGDVYISIVGTIGLSGVIDDELDGANLTENAAKLTGFRGLDAKFVNYYLRSPSGQRQIKSRTVGSTQPKLALFRIGDIKIPLINKSEQQQITSILSSLDDKIELNRRMNKTLEEIGKALFKRWFVDFEFPFDFAQGKPNLEGEPYKSSGGKMVDSELGDLPARGAQAGIPEGWEVSTIGQELETFLGGTPSRTKQEYWENGTIPWINSGKVNDFRITEASEYITEEALDNSAAKLLPKGSVVIAITGATLGQYSLLEIDASFNQSVVGIKENKNLKKEFVYFWIALTINELVNAQTGGAQQHINKQVVASHKILIPKQDLLTNYYEITSHMFNQISKNCFEIKKLSAIRDSLLPRLMSGKLKVT